MRRRLFFWLEKLKITPAERYTVSGLLILLAALGTANFMLSPEIPFGEEIYAELEQQFEERTALLKAKEKRLMQRYFPDSVSVSYITKKDTIPADSSVKRKNLPETAPQKININTANQVALETLPGIGPTYAQRIINYRAKKGGFKSMDELKKIKGIGEKRLDKLKPFIKLKGSE